MAVNFGATDGKDVVNKKEGAAAVKLTGLTAAPKTLTQTVAVSGLLNDIIKFSYWVKASTLPAGGLCQAQIMFYSAGVLKGTRTANCPTGPSYLWKQVKLDTTAPAAFNKIVIKFNFTKISGLVWFDGVSLMK